MKKWCKRYVISVFVAIFVLSAGDAYRQPDHEARVGAVLVGAAVWPIIITITAGSAVGEMMVRERT